MNKYKKHAKELADFMRRLYQQKLTTTLGGNISMKVDDGILITPSQIDKYSLKAYYKLVNYFFHNNINHYQL
jgi:ribulose-5-phosphate 4-epimerase/fuculose-1-phosphate aldolase